MKNQFLYDRLESFKNSHLPYGERQSIWRWEDKITVTKKIPGEMLPSWLSINSLAPPTTASRVATRRAAAATSISATTSWRAMAR